MFTVITPETIQLSPGAVLRFPGTWDDYQKLCQQLGDRHCITYQVLTKANLLRVLNHLFRTAMPVGYLCTPKPRAAVYQLRSDTHSEENDIAMTN